MAENCAGMMEDEKWYRCKYFDDTTENYVIYGGMTKVSMELCDYHAKAHEHALPPHWKMFIVKEIPYRGK
jgi:hypothetical protein